MRNTVNKSKHTQIHNLGEIDQFLVKPLIPFEIDNFNNLITIKEIEFIKIN